MDKEYWKQKLESLNLSQLGIGCLFVIISISLIIADPTSISTLIQINVKDQVFGGNLPALAFVVAVFFFWLGSRQKKDELAEAKKSLDDAVRKVSGRLGTLHIRIGPDGVQGTLRQAQANNLKGKFQIRNGAKVLQNGEVNLYKHPMGNIWIAELKDIYVDDDNLVSITVTDGEQEWSASESIKIRMVNFSA
jgi:hypothetical protein